MQKTEGNNHAIKQSRRTNRAWQPDKQTDTIQIGNPDKQFSGDFLILASTVAFLEGEKATEATLLNVIQNAIL